MRPSAIKQRIIRYGAIVGAVLVIAAGLYAYTQHEISHARVEFPPIGQFVEVDGTRLHYVRTGDGPPIVMIHGLGGMLQDFTSTIVDSLAGQHEVIAFDRPGYGYSDRPRGQRLSIELHARLIHDAVRQLGISRPILVGHSLGGGIALRYALEYPNDVAGVVLIAPAAYPVSRAAQILGKAGNIPYLSSAFYATLAVPVSRLAAPFSVRNAFSPDTVPSWYFGQRMLLTTRPSQIQASAEDLASMNRSLKEQCQRYSSLALPVAIVSGTGDNLVPYLEHSVRLHSEIAQSTLTLLPESGHQIQFAHPAEVVAAIRTMADSVL